MSRRFADDSQGNVEEMLRLFHRVQLDGGNESDGMWAVLARLQARRRRGWRRSVFDRKANAIVEAACAEMGQTRAEVLGPRRDRELVQARWVAMRAMRDLGYSLMSIGAQTRRTHASVAHGLACIGSDRGLVEAAERVRICPRVQQAA